jgi:hypothetical protein
MSLGTLSPHGQSDRAEISRHAIPQRRQPLDPTSGLGRSARVNGSPLLTRCRGWARVPPSPTAPAVAASSDSRHVVRFARTARRSRPKACEVREQSSQPVWRPACVSTSAVAPQTGGRAGGSQWRRGPVRPGPCRPTRQAGCRPFVWRAVRRGRGTAVCRARAAHAGCAGAAPRFRITASVGTSKRRATSATDGCSRI